jgi:hypothetical protein
MDHVSTRSDSASGRVSTYNAQPSSTSLNDPSDPLADRISLPEMFHT